MILLNVSSKRRPDNGWYKSETFRLIDLCMVFCMSACWEIRVFLLLLLLLVVVVGVGVVIVIVVEVVIVVVVVAAAAVVFAAAVAVLING
jgi:hypothetical protein